MSSMVSIWSKYVIFCENGQNWVILEAKQRHRSIFGNSGQKSLSLKVDKNYFSQVYGHKFGQKCHQWG